MASASEAPRAVSPSGCTQGRDPGLLTGPSAWCGAGSQTKSEAQRDSCWKHWVTQTRERGAELEAQFPTHMSECGLR